jgi:hypothetical protein
MEEPKPIEKTNPGTSAFSVVTSILLFGPRRAPSFHPDPLVLNAGGRGALSRMAVARPTPHAIRLPGHSLTGPEHDGTLALVEGPIPLRGPSFPVPLPAGSTVRGKRFWELTQ